MTDKRGEAGSVEGESGVDESLEEKCRIDRRESAATS